MVEVAAAAVAEAAAAVLVKFLSGERQPQNLPQSPFNQQNDSRNDDEYKNDNSKENLLQEKQGGLVLLPQQLLMNPRQDSLPVTSEGKSSLLILP